MNDRADQKAPAPPRGVFLARGRRDLGDHKTATAIVAVGALAFGVIAYHDADSLFGALFCFVVFVACAIGFIWNLRRSPARHDAVVERHNRAALASLPAIIEWRDARGRVVRFTAGGLLAGDEALALDRGGAETLHGWLRPASAAELELERLDVGRAPAELPSGPYRTTGDERLALQLMHDPREVEYEDCDEPDTPFTSHQVPAKHIHVLLPPGEEGRRVARALLEDPRIRRRSGVDV